MVGGDEINVAHMLDDLDTFLQAGGTQCLKMTRIPDLSKIGEIDG
jgi:hypothetical protein